MFAAPVITVVTVLANGGSLKAQGLYQLFRLRTFAGQVMLGLLGSGVPPPAYGSRISVGNAAGPLTVGVLELTVNGFPSCVRKSNVEFQPPVKISSTLL